jgi:hypothetical protein
VNCNHKTESEPVWIKEVCDWDGETDTSHWSESRTESTFRDTGLHTYECTRCKEVFYYSQRAKEELI